MKHTITEMKNTLEGINSRLDDIKEQISKLEDSAVEITQAEQKKEKSTERTEDSISDDCNSTKHVRSGQMDTKKGNGKSEEKKKDMPCKWKGKESEKAILTSDKVLLKQKL